MRTISAVVAENALNGKAGKVEMSYILNDDLPEMKPCPFCGREPALQKDKRYPRMTQGSALPVDAYAVVCNTFSCPIYHADNTWFTTAETAIEKWNDRSDY